MTLELTLLGRPQIKLDGQLSTQITANKALALFYYLAVTRQTHSRQALAGLLWSDLGEEAARRNLRVELNRLREVFDAYLLSSRDTLAFHKALPHRLDVAQFEACLQHPNPSAEQIQAAIDLYQGDFLEDFHVRDAALFETWQLNEREHLRQGAQRLTLRLIQLYKGAHQYDAAIANAHRLLAREPWLEEGHQALMELYARTGRRGNALAQYELCSRALEDEFGVPPSEETNDLYDRILSGEIGPDGEAASQPTPQLGPTPVAPPFQAPPLLLHFVGREQALAQVEAWAAGAGDTPVFALVGMGGVGKSSLAAHLAHYLRDRFADGVLWAHVATSEPLDILGNWARAFGYDFSGLADVENRAAALRGVLAEKRVLIVLDDVRSVARTRPLLLGGSQCLTLVTTRDLDVAVALNARPYRLGQLTPEEGLRLLTRILGEERVAAEREAAQAICARLENLPLAVEITAQRLASRQRRRLADMADRLAHVGERLDLSISDRAVRTSFMVSWESLDANLRRTFALFGVFGGRSFTAAALAHIAGLDTYTAEDRLFALTALSLIGEEGGDRYRQHPLLADFAGEQLGENTLPLVDMAIYYQQFAERHRTDYPALRPEWENLMAGMNAAYKLKQWPLVLAYADALTQAWFVRARYAQARQGYAWAQEAAVALEDAQTQASLLLRYGQACLEQNDYDEARRRLSESLDLYQQIEDEAGIASVQYYLGRLAIEQGQYEEAERLLATSQQLREHLGDQTGVAATMYQQALLAYSRNLHEQAKLLCEQALVMQEQTGDQAGSMPTLRFLVDIALTQQAYDIAENYGKQALALCEKLQDRGEMGATYYSLAVVARFQEKFDLAQSYAEVALDLCIWMGNRWFQALTLYELSRILTLKQENQRALEFGEHSLNLMRELGDMRNMIYVLRHLGDLYHVLQQSKRAHMLWSEALHMAEAQNHPLTQELHQRLASAIFESQ